MSSLRVFLLFLFFSAKLYLTNGKVLIDLGICLKLHGVPEGAFVPRNTSSQLYQQLNYQWNTFNVIEPMAYIVPQNATHVQGAVICGRALGIPMVAKSGGHSYAKYSFGTNSSVIIDFVRMSSIRIHKESSTATIGPGILFAQLHYYLWKHGKYVTPSGFCISVGFGGAALGGGDGYLSKKYGLMADNVLQLEMVTADGSLLKINSTYNEELYWGLRGGGGENFGIVTKFEIRIHKADNFTFKLITLKFPLNKFVPVFNALQKFSQKYLETSAYIFAKIETREITVNIFDLNVSMAQAMEYVAQFPSTENGGSTTVKTYKNFLNVVLQPQIYSNLTSPAQLRTYTRQETAHASVNTKSYFQNKLVGVGALRKLGEVIKRIPATSQIFFFTFGGAINKIKKNATAFVHRDPWYNIELKHDPIDPQTIKWVGQVDEVIKVLDNGGSYQNFVDPSLKDYLKRYYGTNLERLMKLKQNVDPNYYFRFPQSIPPCNSPFGGVLMM